VGVSSVFFPPAGRIIVSSGDERVLESHRREVTVVFIDLRGFTTFSDAAEPEEVIGFLQDYHAEMGRLVFQFKGTLEHFAGDESWSFLMIRFRQRTIRKAVCMAIECKLGEGNAPGMAQERL